MQKFDLKRAGKSLKLCWNKNNQKVLAIVAGACAIGAVVEAIRSTPRATKIAEARRDELDTIAIDLQEGEISSEDYQKRQREVNWRAAKEYALCYGTTMALLILSVGSTACNYRVSIGKQAAILGAYKALEAKSGEFIEKTKELIGEKKFDEIRTSVVKDHIDNATIPEGISDPEYEKDADGNYVAKQYFKGCWEDGTGRPFPGNETIVEQSLFKAAQYCKLNGEISLNKICEYLDPTGRYLPPCDLGENGFVAEDLVDEYSKLPYTLRPVKREGYDHPFTAIIWNVRPVNLDMEN